MFDEILAGLNDRQLEAVTATEGYVRIIAGAGSGKTRALTSRYAYLVKAAGVHPGSILCVTFTNKAAAEMKRRVRALVGDGYDTSLITTYHGFCVRVLREHIGRLFYPENFRILDTADQKTILEEIYAELDLKLDHASFEHIIELINKKKADTAYVDALVSRSPRAETEGRDADARIIERYLQRQKKIFGLDFNDLVNFVFVLFERFPDVKKLWQQRLEYIQVDEFQDSSTRELRLINILSEIKGNLFVVGDPDQNIYEWRGAKVEILVDFDRSHPGTRTVVMDQNYRSTVRILKTANSLIAYNKSRIKKDLFTDGPDGEEVIHLHAKSEAEEGAFICKTIAVHKNAGGDYKDVAVLYRSGFLSRAAEQALMNAGIPYEIVGSAQFFRRMEIMDALAYLRLIASDDDRAFARVINTPRRQFGKSRMALLKTLAADAGLPLYETLRVNASMPEFARTGAGAFIEAIEKLRAEAGELSRSSVLSPERVPVSELLDHALVDTGYEKYIREVGSMERLENLGELKKIALETERSWGGELTLSEFLRQTALMSDYDTAEKSDRVKLMTIHAAKGLEFPVCIVTGMTDGIFPSSRTVEERGQAGLEEERRLCFVALTRAMKRLFLTESEGTRDDGSRQGSRKLPSRFLFEMGEENYRRIGEIPKDLRDEVRARPSYIEPAPRRLSPGDTVSHAIFGQGKIESFDEKRGIYNIKFDKTGSVKPISADYDFAAWSSINETLAAKREKTRLESEARRLAEAPPAPPDKTEAETETKVEEKAEAKLPAPVMTVTPAVPEKEAPPKLDLPDIKSNSSPEADLPKDKPSAQTVPVNTAHVINEEKNRDREITADADNLWERPDVPHEGWECEGITDLGAPTGICGMCGKQIIRYVHHMRHPAYPRTIGAGCICAGRMEGDAERAARREADFKNRESRRITFISRPRKRSKNGNEYIKYKNEIFTILPDKFKKGFFKTAYKGGFTPPRPTVEEALSDAFELIDKA